jgi:hypothetical protein
MFEIKMINLRANSIYRSLTICRVVYEKLF